jgi:sugar lactone lactonase YvrE
MLKGWLVIGLIALGGCKTSDGEKSSEVNAEKEATEQAAADEGEMRTRRFPDPAVAAERTAGDLETVATFDGAMPTGVTVSPEGRIFVNFPRWGDDPTATVAELVDGKVVPYPNADINELDESAPGDHFLSVQSVVVGPAGETLWVLDTASPKFGPTIEGGAKLVGVDLETDEVTHTVVFPSDVALKSTYLNDVRFDYTRGEEGMAYITDSSGAGDNGIIVADLASGESWRRLHKHPTVRAEENFVPIVEGRPLMQKPSPQADPSPMTVGSDGIAIGAGGERLYYRPLSGRGLFSVAMDALSDPDMADEKVAETVKSHGPLGFASDGLEADASGRLYLTNYEDNGVLRWSPDGGLETLVHHPHALWPDTLALADGSLYFTANQLHRQPPFNEGKDLRKKPYQLYRIEIDAEPVRLVPSNRAE